MGTNNPWLPYKQPPQTQTSVAAAPLPATGAMSPQPSVTPPEAGDQLPSFPTTVDARVWVIGTHGGAGESTMATLLEGTSSDHRWPDTASRAAAGTALDIRAVPAVLLTARTHTRGLLAAQLAMRAWAAGHTPHLKLIGLVLVADAPGRLPRELSDLAGVISGGVPHTWHIPWIEEYRTGVDPANTPRPVRKVLTEINTTLDTFHHTAHNAGHQAAQQ